MVFMITRVGAGGEGYNPAECVDDGWRREITCENGHTRSIQHHCWDRACPRCSRAWAVRGSKRTASRIEGLAALFAHLPRHIIISPPVGMFGEHDRLADIRRCIQNVAERSGIHGGAIVIHGWREYHRGQGDWYFSPHAHVIGWGRVASRPVGWIIKVVGAIGSRHHAESTVAYELDHAAYEGNGFALVWYGTTAYARVETSYVKEMHASECVICGAPEHESKIDPENGEHVDFYHLEPHYTAKCRLRARKRTLAARTRRKWGALRTPTRPRA